MKYDIITFGSGLIDIFAETNVHENGRVMAYNIGEKIQIKDLQFAVGGGGINTSTTFSRMGLKTAFFGKIGEDFFAQKILNKIKQEKIKFIGKTKGRTGYSIVLDSKEHDRTILTFKGDNDSAEIKDLPKLETKWFYFSSLAKKSFETQIRLAKSGEYKIAFNPSMYLFKEEDVKKILPFVEILILNKEEADMLSKNHENISKKFGPNIVIVTNGENATNCYTKNKNFRIYTHKDIKVVEKTGAGDAFASGFVSSYIKTQNIPSSLQVGLANSESVLKYKGSTNKILTWEEVERNIKKNPGKLEEW